MGKKVIRLTESELAHIIKEATVASLNEMDGATYARIYNTTHKAKQDIQSGNLQTTKTTTKRHKKDGSLRKKPLVKTTFINNDDIIARGRNMEDRVQQHWLKDFIGQTFMFFGEDRLGIPAHILLTLDKVTKLDPRKTILVGTVVYNNTKIEGDGITIDFTTDKVKYHERGSRYAYTLEIDYRSRELWQKLLEQLKMALDNRK